MQISDSSSRILAGLLEARTGQQLTMSRRWRIETALSALLRERGIATLDELITILVMGKEPSLSQTGGRGLAQQRNLFLPRPRAVRPAPAPCAARARAAARTRPSASGSGRRAARPARKSIRWRCCSPRSPSSGAAGRSTSSAPTFRRRCIDRARAGIYSQFEVQRGLGINQMIKWFEECARRLARGRAAAQAGPLPGPQSARAAAASGRVRHRPVPQRPALPEPGKEGAGVRAAGRRRWPRTAG